MVTEESMVKDMRKNMFQVGESWMVLKQIGQKENCYGSRAEPLMEKIKKDPVALKNFIILVSSCAISMGYKWRYEEETMFDPHWDQREYESNKFCHEHYELFLELFFDFAGFVFPFRDPFSYNEHFIYNFDRRVVKYRSVWEEEMIDFAKEHPAVRQKMMGTFFRTLAAVGIEPEILNVEFPVN